jgi:hypothetical protein
MEHQLRYFATAARTGNWQRAAQSPGSRAKGSRLKRIMRSPYGFARRKATLDGTANPLKEPTSTGHDPGAAR